MTSESVEDFALATALDETQNFVLVFFMGNGV